jgi:hypothetical protein
VVVVSILPGMAVDVVVVLAAIVGVLGGVVHEG